MAVGGALARHAELKPEVTSPNQLRRHRKSPVTANVAVEARTFKLLVREAQLTVCAATTSPLLIACERDRCEGVDVPA